MRTTFLPIAVLFLGAGAHAQITAGQVPAGLVAYDLTNNLALTVNFTTDSIELELDCDDGIDGWAILHRGFPGIDAPHYAALRFYDTEVCMDTAAGNLQRPQYYTHGQVLDCSGGFNWQGGPSFTLGDLGGWVAIGPSVVDSLYIAYQQDGVVGWIRLSFDITDDAEINLQVHRILSICGGTSSIGEHEGEPTITLYPNPTDGRPIAVQSSDFIQRIELIDISGRVIATRPGTTREIPAPETAGIYLMRVISPDGRVVEKPLVRY